jgi:hypothetical protein
MREADVEQYLVKRVKAMGGEVRKVAWVGRRHAPDRLVMIPDSVIDKTGCIRWIPARSFFVELKAPGKRPRAGQQREIERMRECKLRVEVIDSLEAVEAVLT